MRRLYLIRRAAVATLSLALLAAASLAAVAAPSEAQSVVGGTIVNFAGSAAGTAGNAGDGGPATSASLNTPVGMAVDSAGNVYIADFKNNRVRKVSPTGTITNFAGSPDGTAGNTGDGGPATSALLDNPTAVAVDAAGNVYIDDSQNSRIRKVDTAGTITNFAGSPAGIPGNAGDGGPAASATFGRPGDVAIDAAGNVYIADGLNNRVRKVDTAGIVTNFAGSAAMTAGNAGDGGPATSATLLDPYVVAVDAGGNVYVIDGNNRVRAVDVGGTITNFAGSPDGTVGDTGDGGPATAATLNHPSGLAVDSAGNVYVADFNNRVRRIDSGGTITDFAGAAGTTGNAGDGGPATSATLSTPDGVAVDAAGNVYIATYFTNRIREVVSGAPSITSAASAAFTVGVSGSLTVTTNGFPAPTVAETGPLPPGVTFDDMTDTLGGTPGQGTVGSYPITITATNGIGDGASQSFTLTVDQATMTYPTDGQTNVDTTKNFTWSTIPEAQAYFLVVGTTKYGTNLVNSGVLPDTQSSFAVPALPSGPTLFATVLAEVNNSWTSYQAITFTAAPGEASFTFPLNAQSGIDPTKAFTWSTIPEAQGYIVVVGTSRFGSDVANSGVLSPTQSSFSPPILPAGKILYVALLTKVNGAFTRYQAITFTAGPAMGTLTHPINGQLKVATPSPFTWSTIAPAQHYYLVVGTTLYGTDLVNSGILPPTQSSFAVPALPGNKLLYATLLTEVNGTWVDQVVGFTAS